MGIVIGIIVVLALAGLFAFLTCKSKNTDLFKWVLIALFIAFCLTWVIPYGYFQEGTFYEYGMSRLGLNDIPTLLYYSIYFCLSSVLYLFVLGGFYGVISKTEGYKALVKKFAKALKGKELLFTIIVSVLLIGLTSITKTALAMLVFVPFIVSILLNMKLDKLTAFAVSFGSILVGTLAATYGTDGLYWLNSYLGTEISVGFWYRVIIAGIATVLFVIFNSFRVAKALKKNRVNDLEDDLFAVEESKGKVALWPTIVVLSFVTVFVILAYVGWSSNFNITWFDSFHTWLTELSVKVKGEDFTIFSYILGKNAVALGKMEITSLITVLLIASSFVALMSRMKFNEFMSAFGNGFAKMFKPVALYALTYSVFVVAYMSPFIPAVTNWAFGLTKSFNPYIATLTAFITSIFHADLGYTGYIVGTYLTTTYQSNLSIVHTIYVATYGLAQVFIPTGGLLLIGLSYLKIDYKSWFKYIWMFAVAMVLVLVILVTIATYIIK